MQHTHRQAKKAFFPINIIDCEEDTLLELALYKDSNNFRKIHLLNSQTEATAYPSIDIILYKEENWQMIDGSFIDPSLKEYFVDNFPNKGKGQPNKDKTIAKLQSRALPASFSYDEVSLLNFYDLFFCGYKIKNTEQSEQLNIFPHKIFKLSHGNKDISSELHKKLLDSRLVTVHKDTPAKGTSKTKQGDDFINAEIGDYFYLCKGNSYVELLGRFTSEARPDKLGILSDESWYVREFETVTEAINNKPYKSISKWWTPNNNSTFIRIGNKALTLANTKIFNPFFAVNVINKEYDRTMEPITKILEAKKQVILQGAPGTGKTYATAELALRTIGEKQIDFSDREAVMQAYKAAEKRGQIVFTTFHQSLDYEEFIEGIKPIPNNDKDIAYDVMPGMFLKLCEKAKIKIENNFEEVYEKFIDDISNLDELLELKTVKNKTFGVALNSANNLSLYTGEDLGQNGTLTKSKLYSVLLGNKGITRRRGYYIGVLNYLKAKYNLTVTGKELDKNYVLIIDEINRGNISKIFGELITLLEADKREGKTNQVTCKLPYSSEEFTVPDNLYIIGTMNTTDRSLGHIDYAVRRRFGFVTLESKEEAITNYYQKTGDSVLGKKASDLFAKVEALVKENTSPEFQSKDIMVGHSYFMAENKIDLQLKLDYEIKPLLSEYVKDGLLTLTMEDIVTKIDSLVL